MLFVVICSCVAAVVSSEHIISIDTSIGIDNETCWEGHHPCLTFIHAIKGVTYNSTIVKIAPGYYTLNESYDFTDKTDLTIIGEASSHEVIIECLDNTSGLAFTRITNMTLMYITFTHCGALRNSSSRNLYSAKFQFIEYHVATYMLFCHHVTMIDVSWIDSYSTSLTMYNVKGNVIIKNCTFNGSSAGDYPRNNGGGGALQIEFTYCVPGDIECHHNELISYNYGNIYNITHTQFINNRAFKGSSKLYKPKQEKKDAFNFGKGGGISIITSRSAANNHFTIHHCIFDNNAAHKGGGFYISFRDTSHLNRVHMSNCTISNNFNYDAITSIWDTDATGGGGKISYFNILYTPLAYNRVFITKSDICHNMGVSGGGLTVQSSTESVLFDRVSLSYNNFYNNNAYLGSAIYLAQRINNLKLFVELIGNNFTHNTPLCNKNQSFSSLPCAGVIYTTNLPLRFGGINKFFKNKATPLEVHNSKSIIYDGSVMIFKNNTSNSNGGGVALYDCSYLHISNEAKFHFEDNTASGDGGGIYSGICSENGQVAFVYSNCFVTYDDPATKHNAHFNFSNNKADDVTNNAVYVSSLSSCWSPSKPNVSVIKLDDIEQTLCWDNWVYYNSNCDDSIKSGISFITLNSSYSMYPGQYLIIPHMYDGRNHTILDISILSFRVISGSAVFQDGKKFSPPSTYQVQVYSNSNNDNSTSLNLITMTTLNSISATISIEFLECEWPFINRQIYDHNYNSCIINSDYFCCVSTCPVESSCTYDDYVWIKNNAYCVTSYNDDIYIADCPVSYNNPSYEQNLSSYTNNCISSSFSKRSGTLCSECSTNYSVPINGFYLECTDCGGSILIGWLLFIFAQMLPLTLMVIIIILFDVRLALGSMNAFVFYCQMVSISFPGWIYPAWLSKADLFVNYIEVFNDGIPALTHTNALTSLASIWNLNFMSPISYPICVSGDMSSLGAIAFWYVITLYPFILLLFIITWFVLYDKNYKLVRCVTVPIHKLLARFWRTFNINKPSFPHMIASIYILCYSQLVTTSFKLLKPSIRHSLKHENYSAIVSFYDGSSLYFSDNHIWYGLLALVVLIFTVFIPTLFIVFYQFNWFHKALSCCRLQKYLWIRHLMDAFTVSFNGYGKYHKIGHQYFAGLYLILRILPLAVFYLPVELYTVQLYVETLGIVAFAGILMIVRPHKSNYHNFGDFLIFIYLAFLSALTISIESNLHDPYERMKIIFILINVPIAFYTIYVIYVIFKMLFNCCKYCKEICFKRKPVLIEYDEKETDVESDHDDGEFADRILRPEHYSGSEIETSSEYTAIGNDRNDDYWTPQGSKSTRLTSRASTRGTTYGTTN
jgi:predicted outer membrane repeat protein